MPDIIPSASGGEQRPTPDIPAELASYMALLSPWRLSWEDAEQELLNERPEGFHPEDIGRRAFGRLHEDWRPGALGVLSYAYYEARRGHSEELARFEAGQPLRAKASTLLDEAESLLSRGAEVTPELVATLVQLARTLIGGAR